MLGLLLKANPQTFFAVIQKFIEGMAKDLPVNPFVSMITSFGDEVAIGLMGMELETLRKTLLPVKVNQQGREVPYLSNDVNAFLQTAKAKDWWDRFQKSLNAAMSDDNYEDDEIEEDNIIQAPQPTVAVEPEKETELLNETEENDEF